MINDWFRPIRQSEPIISYLLANQSMNSLLLTETNQSNWFRMALLGLSG